MRSSPDTRRSGPIETVIDTLGRGSFAAGFLKPGGDPGWPKGVQEETDVHWNWAPPREADATHVDPPEPPSGGHDATVFPVTRVRFAVREASRPT